MDTMGVHVISTLFLVLGTLGTAFLLALVGGMWLVDHVLRGTTPGSGAGVGPAMLGAAMLFGIVHGSPVVALCLLAGGVAYALGV